MIPVLDEDYLVAGGFDGWTTEDFLEDSKEGGLEQHSRHLAVHCDAMQHLDAAMVGHVIICFIVR